MLVKEKKLKVDDKEYTCTPVLTTDLKAMMKLLGLYDVFHPCSRWKCPYCHVSSKYASCGVTVWCGVVRV